MMRAAVFLSALLLCLAIIGAAGVYAGTVQQSPEEDGQTASLLSYVYPEYEPTC